LTEVKELAPSIRYLHLNRRLKMKVSIDRDQCISCAVCWSECPELFEEDPGDGKSRVAEKYRTSGDVSRGEAPESLRGAGQRAAEGCPIAIIHIE
jgi:ferredoxin